MRLGKFLYEKQAPARMLFSSLSLISVTGSAIFVEGVPVFTIALAQMQVDALRPDENVSRMLRFIAQARQHGAHLVVFPELCISGYIIGDCWEQARVVEDFVLTAKISARQALA